VCINCSFFTFIVHSTNHSLFQYCSVLNLFYRAVKATFVKVGKIVSEEVVIQFMNTILSISLYGFECVPLKNSDLKFLDFTVNRFFMKLFTSWNIKLINE